ncbi:hypothetical protein SERLADRAFT_437878 [Serpula lacrymans var. lacrymans S7.9]|nr:uncharacterized protein SERLADRAFT_437878 [Serpula lacrymans var. lacrymans S7.9]EGO24266.1 hypothetical protein SERLADRAFT_437878 [Serpula lacrymans var. lacrymans S7.9]
MDNVPTEILEAAPMIKTVLPKDLRQKNCKKYQYLSRKYCERHNKEVDVLEEGLKDEGDVCKALSKPVRDSQAESLSLHHHLETITYLDQKLKQCIQKHPLLQYQDSKYNAAFIINAMSDDKDDPD